MYARRRVSLRNFTLLPKGLTHHWRRGNHSPCSNLTGRISRLLLSHSCGSKRGRSCNAKTTGIVLAGYSQALHLVLGVS